MTGGPAPPCHPATVPPTAFVLQEACGRCGPNRTHTDGVVARWEGPSGNPSAGDAKSGIHPRPVPRTTRSTAPTGEGSIAVWQSPVAPPSPSPSREPAVDCADEEGNAGADDTGTSWTHHRDALLRRLIRGCPQRTPMEPIEVVDLGDQNIQQARETVALRMIGPLGGWVGDHTHPGLRAHHSCQRSCAWWSPPRTS